MHLISEMPGYKKGGGYFILETMLFTGLHLKMYPAPSLRAQA
jgi:hypothetical protein